MPTRKHIVRFYSPGTFASEMSTRPIEGWLPVVAARMAKDIVERHGAKPYGFQFVTLLTAEPVSDREGGTLKVQAKEVASSAMHYLTGRVVRYEDVPETPETRIQRSNMRRNGIPLVVENTNSYRSTWPFTEKSVIVDTDGEVIERGDAPEWMEYRQQTIERWEAAKKEAPSEAKTRHRLDNPKHGTAAEPLARHGHGRHG